MKEEEMPNEELSLLQNFTQTLSKITRQEFFGYSKWDKVKVWYARARPTISEYWPKEIEQFDSYMEIRWVSRRIKQNPTKQEYEELKRDAEYANNNLAINATDQLLAILDGLALIITIEAKKAQDLAVEQKRLENKAQALPTAHQVSPAPIQTNKVFVVHGHDNEMRLSVSRILTNLGLNPVVLHECPDAGNTIIEKFEKHADVSFAVVLLSPDDMSFVRGSSHKTAKPRARQNVVFELGYFIGKLGRERVFVLKRDDNLEIHSDFSGVIYTLFDGFGGWQLKLAKEMKEANYNVDSNNL